MEIKTVWCYLQINHHNRIESLEINPCTYDQLIFHKDTKSMEERILFQQMVPGELYGHMKKNEFESLPHIVCIR